MPAPLCLSAEASGTPLCGDVVPAPMPCCVALCSSSPDVPASSVNTGAFRASATGSVLLRASSSSMSTLDMLLAVLAASALVLEDRACLCSPAPGFCAACALMERDWMPERGGPCLPSMRGLPWIAPRQAHLSIQIGSHLHKVEKQ